ncbi:hypothetical protein DFH27DRAFT_571009 [Peziza echinospora]|nr:hypothetical protein DFH27DRAFT_571009 [Peziza echinospora]
MFFEYQTHRCSTYLPTYLLLLLLLQSLFRMASLDKKIRTQDKYPHNVNSQLTTYSNSESISLPKYFGLFFDLI